MIAENLAMLQKPGVLAVRAGYKVVGGWPTRKPAIVVTVLRKSDAVPEEGRRSALPEAVRSGADTDRTAIR